MTGPRSEPIVTPLYTYFVAGVLLVAVAYSVCLVTIVLPALPAPSRIPLGMLAQLLVFTGAAIVLFVLRSSDPTAALAVLALALSGMANAGPAPGASWDVPLGSTLAGIAAIASPTAFPIIALAMLYFPSRSPLIVRHPALLAVPWITALPMIVIGTARALQGWGAEAASGLVAWATDHPAFYHASFAAALGLNLAALGEGIYRYRFNHDANERRRIRMAVYTAVPGVIAWAVHKGLPVIAGLGGSEPPALPRALDLTLQALILLPAFGLAYAVGVERVLGPRVMLRRSLQYALASRTLTVLVFLPVIALISSLIQDRNERLADIVTSRAILYLFLIASLVAALRYRAQARQWLDQQFFREEYDARKILLSLASRVRFETDPVDLATMVVQQVDEALHPELVAVMAAGVEEGRLASVASSASPPAAFADEGGIATLLRWSDQPLEIFLDDPRSSARRLPPDEQDWLHKTGVTLLVPVLGTERALVGVVALGAKRSEEAYTEEDRQLLASIASQVALGFDVARLRRRTSSSPTPGNVTTRLTPAALAPMVECPRCGRCEDAGTVACPSDGATMQPVPSVPRSVDNKYRIEQLLGRGGMGAVYRARDVRLDRLVALKVVRADMLGDAETRQRFRREAQVIARLQHPAIVSIFDYGTFQDGGAYLVMELIRGEDLRRILIREGHLGLTRSLKILRAVCGAIDYAHREGVLHRDLKPENILLPPGGVDAKVLDFGVAKVMRGEQPAPIPSVDSGSLVTAPGMIVGTPAYMPPEQFNGMTPDARSDVFSLGVIAFEMLTGRLPFGRGSLAEIVLAQARGVVFDRDWNLPVPLERALRSALHQDPDNRPSSARAFLQMLESA